ncbi:MAG: hypothetical protein JO224_08525 [Pelomonas sp.]|nr:hypothetical protein [Roseateles sp.]
MKYLLLLLGLAWLFNKFGARKRTVTRDAPPPQAVVACAHCGLHLPADEALPGRGGPFCCAAHRNIHEAMHG